MYEIGYKCMSCRWVSRGTEPRYKCAKCGGAIEVVYDYAKMSDAFISQQFRHMPPVHMKYYFALPLKRPARAVTMGEGGTPLIPLSKKLMVKFEGINPTGSFKDRGSSAEISKAVELGRDTVVCASTGNMGASIAAYASAAGIKAVIFTPGFAEPVKLKQMRYYGADVRTAGETYSEALRASVECAKGCGAYLTGDYPYRLEGQKTVAYEIVDQMNFMVPDNIIIPVGNGTLFYATYKAFLEMRRLGIAKRMPRLIAVQAQGCRPIVDAVEIGAESVACAEGASTIADAINCDYPVDGAGVLTAIRKSGGSAVAVGDEEMIVAKKQLALRGIYAEISSAAAYAAYLKMGEGLKGRTVVVATGIGFKDNY